MALKLPEIDHLLPANTHGAVALFWVSYWLWFLLLLPWMLLRQVGVVLHHLCCALWTWNREFQLLDGRLRIRFLNSVPSLVVTSIFGERFTCLQYGDVLVDPGPVFAKRQLRRRLAGARVSAIVVTHAHEEHTGNALEASQVTHAPIYGTEVTLAAITAPERLSAPRRFFIGQPEAADASDLRVLPTQLTTPENCLLTIQSPGHCKGHASLFDEARGVLLAGDSFLHTVFTSPNREVRVDDWIRTLDGYLSRRIVTMVGAHGHVYTLDPSTKVRRFLVRRRDPLELIRDKREFLLWAREVVARGEARQLPYGVIEACLFPWQRPWSWRNWFGDELGRLFSAGEFSRTFFVRSLSSTPEKVPARFGLFARLVH